PCALPHPDASEDRVKCASPFADAEIKHLHLRRREDRMLAPAATAVFALGIPVNQMVLMIRPRDVPHFPLTVVIDEVGFVDASTLPQLVRDKDGLGVIQPLDTIPF